jgi:phage-related minor tail protein
MVISDLDKTLREYIKHFGKEAIQKYFNNLIKENNNATSKKKVNSSVRSD